MSNAWPKSTTAKADATAAGRRLTTRAKGKAAQPELGDHPDTLGKTARTVDAG